MPNYLVTFAEPVWYQPDHPIAKRQITELPVQGAATEEVARAHAYKTTSGWAEIASIVQVAKFPRPEPVVEVINDPPTIQIDARGDFP